MAGDYCFGGPLTPHYGGPDLLLCVVRRRRFNGLRLVADARIGAASASPMVFNAVT